MNTGYIDGKPGYQLCYANRIDLLNEFTLKQMTEQKNKPIVELLEMKPFDVNPNFINPGNFHEVGMLSTNPQTGQQGILKRIVYIESVEIVGGTAWLGLREYGEFKLSEDKTKVESADLYDTVTYHNIGMFCEIQTYENKVRFLQEDKRRKDTIAAIKKELQEVKDDRPDDTTG